MIRIKLQSYKKDRHASQRSSPEQFKINLKIYTMKNAMRK